MSALSFGIIGKQNEPIYLLSTNMNNSSTDVFNIDSDTLHYQSMIFMSLDIIEERRNKKHTTPSSISDSFLGQLLLIGRKIFMIMINL
jgi:hypothetical protein